MRVPRGPLTHRFAFCARWRIGGPGWVTRVTCSARDTSFRVMLDFAPAGNFALNATASGVRRPKAPQKGTKSHKKGIKTVGETRRRQAASQCSADFSWLFVPFCGHSGQHRAPGFRFEREVSNHFFPPSAATQYKFRPPLMYSRPSATAGDACDGSPRSPVPSTSGFGPAWITKLFPPLAK